MGGALWTLAGRVLAFSMAALFNRCPVQARGKRDGSCQLLASKDIRARVAGPTWSAGDFICSAYCCKSSAGLNVYDATKECARKRAKRQKEAAKRQKLQEAPQEALPYDPVPQAGTGRGGPLMEEMERMAVKLNINIQGYTRFAAMKALYAAAGFAALAGTMDQRLQALADGLGMELSPCLQLPIDSSNPYLKRLAVAALPPPRPPSSLCSCKGPARCARCGVLSWSS